jgi:hypothetical protein
VTLKRKLFLSFLLLSFLPTAILILFSYYLATQGSRLLASRGVSETLAAADSLAMWVVADQQDLLTSDLQSLLVAPESELSAAVHRDSTLDLVILTRGDKTSLYHNLSPSRLETLLLELKADTVTDVRSRSVIDGRLLVWQRLRSMQVTLTAARFLPEEYFRLADLTITGKERYESLAQTLLPVGQGLLLKIAISLIIVSLLLSLLAAQMLSFSTSAPKSPMMKAISSTFPP